MSGFEVVPGSLHLQAAQCDRVAADLTAAAQVLAAVVTPDTGSPFGTALTDRLRQLASEQALALASQAAYDAQALRAASAGYCVAELTAGGGPCG